MAELGLHGVQDINTIVNYDPTIAPFLDAPPGGAFSRVADGTFRSIEQDARSRL
jgi:hypothetical protein